MLIVPKLVGYAASFPRKLTISHESSGTDGVDRTVYTFSSLAFGAVPAAGERRFLVVSVGAVENGTGAFSISSLTVAGIAATLVVAQINVIANQAASAIYYLELLTGTSGDVVVTFNTQIALCGVAIARVISNAGFLVHHTSVDVVDSIDLSLNIPRNGVAVGTTQSINSTGSTWTGLTEVVDTEIPTGEFFSVAQDQFTVAETARTIQMDASGSPAELSGVAASFSA